MALRLLEVLIPESHADQVEEVVAFIEEQPVQDVWHERLPSGRIQVKVLVGAEDTEAILDDLEARFSTVEGFGAVILDVQAALPTPEEDEDEADDEEETAAPARVSRAELYERVREMAEPSTTFAVLMALASVVAVIGFLLDNIAVIIGSMVIAPLLGPSVGMALATTLSDRDLALASVKAQAAGIAIVGVVAGGLGAVLNIDPTLSQLAIRSRVSLWDVGLGLAVGAAGVLSVTTGVSAALVGVMVAVALIPPLAAFGLLLGGGHLVEAAQALLLLLTYLISINLAGVVTFVLQGVHPRRWWEAEQAKRSAIQVALLWAGLLGVLVGIIWWTGTL